MILTNHGYAYGYFQAGTGKARWSRSTILDRMEIRRRRRNRERAEKAMSLQRGWRLK